MLGFFACSGRCLFAGLWVRKQIGPLATPDLIHFTPGLPKTRSGKIMRRILRKIAHNEHGQLGDTTTLADPSVQSFGLAYAILQKQSGRSRSGNRIQAYESHDGRYGDEGFTGEPIRNVSRHDERVCFGEGCVSRPGDESIGLQRGCEWCERKLEACAEQGDDGYHCKDERREESTDGRQPASV